MNISARVFQNFPGRRRQSIDPARHFAVRIRNGYADPVSREQFLSAVHRVGGMASLLKKIAAAGMRDAARRVEARDGNKPLRAAIAEKLAHAQKMQSDFEAFVRQLIFGDQTAFAAVEQARKGMAEAIDEIKHALAALDRTSSGSTGQPFG
jgi:hypothetical protein